jgi:hypothetical protein
MGTKVTTKTIIENIIEGITKIRIRRGTELNLPSPSMNTQGEPRFTLDTSDLYIDNGIENILIGGKTALDNKVSRVETPNILYGTGTIGEAKTFNIEDMPSMNLVESKITKTDTNDRLYGLYNGSVQEIVDFKLYHRLDFTINQLLNGASIKSITFPLTPSYNIGDKLFVDWEFNILNVGIKKIRFTPTTINMLNQNNTPANDGITPENIEGILYRNVWNNFNNFGITTITSNNNFIVRFPKGTTLVVKDPLEDIGMGLFDAEFYPDKGLITKETFMSLKDAIENKPSTPTVPDPPSDPTNPISKPTYTTEEVDTGEVWLNGKHVYRKTFIGQIDVQNYGFCYAEFIPLPIIDTIVRSYGEANLYSTTTQMVYSIPASIQWYIHEPPVSLADLKFVDMGVQKYKAPEETYYRLRLYASSNYVIPDVKYTITVEYTKS